MRQLPLLVVLTVGPASAWGQASPTIETPVKASEKVLVPKDGAADYRLTVHRDFGTNLYFPEAIERAWNSNQEDFEVSAKGDVLRVRAKTLKVSDGNISVTTKTLKVSVHVATGKKSAARLQVYFEKYDREQEIQKEVRKRVDERVAEVRKELEKESSRKFEAEQGQRIAWLLSEAVRGSSKHELSKVGRSSEHVIVRLQHVLRVGDVALVSFEIQNRSQRDFAVESVWLKRDGKGRKAEVRFLGAGGAVVEQAIAPVDARLSGVVFAARGRLDFRFVAKGQREVRIDDVVVP